MLEILAKIGFANLVICLGGIYLLLIGSGTPLPPKMLRGKVSMIVIAVLMLLWSGSAIFVVLTAKPVGELILQEVRAKVQPPTSFDEYARIDDITLEGGNRIVWHMSISMPDQQAVAMTEEMKTRLRAQVCEPGEFGNALRLGVSVEVRFNDRNGQQISNVLVMPGDCNFQAQPQQKQP